MKSTVLFLALAGLMSIGLSVMAEPIMRAVDSTPVTIDIAKWVWVEIKSTDDGFLLDYEAAAPYAEDTLVFRVGHNCNVRMTGSLVPPPGAPGTWTWWFQGDGQNRRLLLDGPVPSPDVQDGPGVYEGKVSVKVTGIGITDRATTYDGGEYTINIDAL